MVDNLVKTVEVMGYKVRQCASSRFCFMDENVRVDIEVEGNKGELITKVLGYLDKNKDRYYQAQRYTVKFEHKARLISQWLAENNYIWDYGKNEPFYKTYNEKIERLYKENLPYFHKCVLEGCPTLYIDGKPMYRVPDLDDFKKSQGFLKFNVVNQ